MTRRFAVELSKAVGVVIIGGIVIATVVIMLFPTNQPYYSTMAERRSTVLVEPNTTSK